jgi:hypothetical protein
MISEWDGAALRAWLADADSPQASIDGIELERDTDLADRMAYFSSRGPDLNMAGVIKPDVTAPGVAILAGFGPLSAIAARWRSGAIQIAWRRCSACFRSVTSVWLPTTLRARPWASRDTARLCSMEKSIANC